MGTPLAAIGVKIGYMVEVPTWFDSTPTYSASKHFIHLPDLKTTADFNPAPNTADASTFDNLEYTTYVDLLKDLGGALEFNANLTAEFKTAWEACVTAYTGRASNKVMWFVVDIPGVTDSVYFYGKPSSMGLPQLTANTLMETTVYITPNGEPTWHTDPVQSTTVYDIWGEKASS